MPNRPKRKSRPSVAEHHRNKPASHKIKSKTNWPMLIIIGVAIVAFIWTSIPKAPSGTTGISSGNNSTMADRPGAPRFTHEGNATISRDGQTISQLEIEFAEDRESQALGLMYRTSMQPNRGMIFLMEDTKIQVFHMLNTYISLDIIFLDENQRIVNVAENCTPRSTDQIPSTGPAAYVLETVAGYASQHGLQPGDLVEWERL